MKKTLIICATIALFLVSCGTTHTTQTNGKTTVITTDTTVIYHGGNTNIQIKTPVR